MFFNYNNLQNITLIIGNIGSGKSTVGTAIAQKCIKKGIRVFTNYPCPNCYKYSDYDLGKFDTKGSVVILDEAGISFDNRTSTSASTNKMSPERVKWLKLIRHFIDESGRSCKLIVISQSLDFDKKFIVLAQDIFFVTKSWLKTSKCTLVKRRVGIDPNTNTLQDMFIECKGFAGIGKNFRIYRPRWYKYFDSFAADPLPDTHKELWSFQK